MVTKTKFPGICNNCGKKSEFIIRCGIHTLQLCGTCAIRLSSELMKTCREDKGGLEQEYNNSVETGLIKDVHKTPKTGGVV